MAGHKLSREHRMPGSPGWKAPAGVREQRKPDVR